MILDDWKKLFRRNIKVVAGGPEDKTRGAKVIAIFDALAKALTELLLSKTATLAEGQDLLNNPVPALEDGARYAFTGLWDGLTTESTVYVRAMTTSTFELTGTLLRDGVRSLVEVDVAAGTTALLGVDAYTKAESDALRNSLLDLLTAEAAARQQGDADLAASLNARIAQVIGAAPAALDTLAEIAAQLKADEQGSAAILSTQQQHTQQITALQALGGRNRAVWAAGTGYKQNDWVVRAELLYYANADFISGTTFDATKWTQFGAGLTAAQVLALNPLTYPVMALTPSGLKGYNSFEDAAEAGELNLLLNVSTTITRDVSFYGTLRASGAELSIADGVTLGIITGAVFNGVKISRKGTAKTGVLAVIGSSGTSTGPITAARSVQLVDCTLSVAVAMDNQFGQGIAARGKTAVTVTGNGQLFLYDLSTANAATGIMVTYLRPQDFTTGGGNGSSYTLSPATTTTLGGIKVGAGLAVAADGTLSASGGGGGVSYTDEQAQDAFAALLAQGAQSGISFVYNDASNKLDVTVSAAATGPWPPFTNGVTNDGAKIFSATAPPFFRTPELEYTRNGGGVAAVVTESMRSGDTVTVQVPGALAVNQVGLRVRAGSGRPAGPWLFNQDDFSGAAVAPAGYLVNPDFDADLSGWNSQGAWAYNDGKAVTSTPDNYLYQDFPVTAGRQYLISGNVTLTGAAQLFFVFSGANETATISQSGDFHYYHRHQSAPTHEAE
jgi:hypothetical protein